MNQPLRASAILCGLMGYLLTSSVPAYSQDFRNGSLSGYGGSSTGLDSGIGMSGGTIIPYNGTFGGFMPSRMGGTGSLSFRPFTRSEMAPPRASFRLSPMTGGMSSMSGNGLSPSLGGVGSGSIGGMGTSVGMGGAPKAMGVMPPSFGYPFRQPPSLLGPSSTGIGMSM